MKTRTALFVLAALLLAIVAPVAQADTLEIGSNYRTIYMDWGGSTHTEGGGNIQVSKLNGLALDNLYCIDLYTVVYVPGTYNASIVTNNGVVNGVLQNGVHQVEWLMDQYADDALAATGQAKSDREVALQAAIWNVIHGVTLSATGNSAQAIAWYNEYLDDFLPGGGYVAPSTSNWFWISPRKSGDSTVYQGLIGGPSLTTSSIVPEGGSLALLLTGLAPLGLALRRRVRR